MPHNLPGSSDDATHFAVLIFTDICDSTGLKAKHGALAYKAAAELHNRLFEKLAADEKLTLVKNTGDGYFARTTSLAAAVRFALRFQYGMRMMAWPSFALTARLGIHAGEVVDITTLGQADVIAPAADLVARIMSLATGGQILMSRWPFDEARHFVRAHPPIEHGEVPELKWLAHGPYLFKGCDDPIEVFEVGAAPFAPLAAPPDSEKAKRAIRPGDEVTLGWRPADGSEIPGRPGWRLVEKLGAGGFGEVWAGEHETTHDRRAYKFCFDAERLRALKREVTLVRLLRETLGERDDIVRIYDLRLDEPPYFLETELAAQGNLLQWAEKQGGLGAIPLSTRVELVAASATALAAAHSVGVLHKDVKPTNVLIFSGNDGGARPRLVDFGIGMLADPNVLAEHGITGGGFTGGKSIQHSTGTPTYSPPEYLAGKPYTVQGDVYALGVMLYQLVIADATRPLAEGWQRDVPDGLLRADIAACVDGDPVRRLPSATELAIRLRSLDERAAEAQRLAAAEAARRTRKHRQRVLTVAAIAAVLIAAVSAPFAWWALREKRLAEQESFKTSVSELSERLKVQRLLRSVDAVWESAIQRDPELSKLNRSSIYEGIERTFLLLGAWNVAVSAERWASARNYSADFKHRLSSGVSTAVEAAVFGAEDHGIRPNLYGDNEKEREDKALGAARLLLRVTELSVNACRRIDDNFTAELVYEKSAASFERQSAKFGEGRLAREILFVLCRLQEERCEYLHEKGSDSARRHAWQDLQRTLQSLSKYPQDKEALSWTKRIATARVKLGRFKHAESVCSAQFSPEGNRIVTGSFDNNARVWDAHTGQPLTEPMRHDAKVESAQFSPDGNWIVTASSDKTARVWDAHTGQPLTEPMRHDANVESAQFSPDGRCIVTVSYVKPARVWDTQTGQPLTHLIEHDAEVSSAQFSPEGNRIVTASWYKKIARVWDAQTGQPLTEPMKHDAPVESAQFSPDGNRIVTASDDKTARVWDVHTGQPLTTPMKHDGSVHSAQFSPDSKRIVTASWDQTARVWDAHTGQPLTAPMKHDGSVHSAQFSPDAKRIVTASDDAAWVWDAQTGQPLTHLIEHYDDLSAAQFSGDGKWIVTASADKTARVWDIPPAGKRVSNVCHASRKRLVASTSAIGASLSQ